jgi:LysM repeat protein
MTENAEKGLPYHWNVVEWSVFLAIIIIPFTLHSGFFGATDSTTSDAVKAAERTVSHSVLDLPILSALQNPNPQGYRGGAEVVVNEDTLVSSGPVGKDVIIAARGGLGEISVYTVREGDTLSHIAEMYGVTANTILWANDLPRATAIQAGQTLVILPVAGVQHVVKKGDTLAALAKKYDGDLEEIMAYNQITSNTELVIGETIVIPGGVISIPSTVATPTKIAGSSSSGGWLTHPIPGGIKTQGIHGYNAVDFGASLGTAIRAAGAGEVIVSRSSGWNGGYGQYIVIRHKNGAQTLYAHLSRNDVGVGTYVSQGQVIGASGNTGRSTGPHLHFEVRGAGNPF